MLETQGWWKLNKKKILVGIWPCIHYISYFNAKWLIRSIIFPKCKGCTINYWLDHQQGKKAHVLLKICFDCIFFIYYFRTDCTLAINKITQADLAINNLLLVKTVGVIRDPFTSKFLHYQQSLAVVNLHL